MRWRDVGVDELIMLLKRYFGAARTDFYLENVSGPEQFIYYLVIRRGIIIWLPRLGFSGRGSGVVEYVGLSVVRSVCSSSLVSTCPGDSVAILAQVRIVWFKPALARS